MPAEPSDVSNNANCMSIPVCRTHCRSNRLRVFDRLAFRRMGYALILAIALFLQPASGLAAELVVSTSDLSVQVSGPWQTGTIPGSNQEYLFRTPGAGGATVFWPS